VALEHSLRARASAPLEFTWLKTSSDPASPCYTDPKTGAGWRIEHWATPWTALRWAVPALCGWAGRAIYFDCPTIVLGDVADLAVAPMPRGVFVLARRAGRELRTACLVFDCAAARPWLGDIVAMQTDPGAHQRVGQLLDQHPQLVGFLPAGWGLDDAAYSAAPGEATGSVHCANPRTQPHMPRAVGGLARADRRHWHDEVLLPHYCARLTQLFEDEYIAAQAAGLTLAQYGVEEEKVA